VKLSKYLEQASQLLHEGTKNHNHFNNYLAAAKELARLAEIERGPIPTYVVIVNSPSLVDGKGPTTLTISADGLRVTEGDAVVHRDQATARSASDTA
jgi:hypothetical protein